MDKQHLNVIQNMHEDLDILDKILTGMPHARLPEAYIEFGEYIIRFSKPTITVACANEERRLRDCPVYLRVYVIQELPRLIEKINSLEDQFYRDLIKSQKILEEIIEDLDATIPLHNTET